MPSIEWNREQWSGPRTGWRECGEGWSEPWGGVDMQWHGSLLPRIREFLPAGTILEIACGFGRWTQFLKDSCDHLIAIDLVDKCVEACKRRFADSSHISYFVNDGKSLDMVEDGSVDFAFSFDSLVHVEPVVMQSYISQLARKLKPGGSAFLHHSNLGEYSYYREMGKIPKLLGVLGRLGITERNLHNRDRSMSARLMVQFAEESGLVCRSQEIVNWRTKTALIDCFSVISRGPTSSAPVKNVFRNAHFMRDAQQLLELSRLYQGKSVSAKNGDVRAVAV